VRFDRALDPEHAGCLNLRAMAEVKLGRKAQAAATIEAALARDPENAGTHANRGWTYLEESDPGRALEHFREALRLDPENEWAREGMVEALKARHGVYRLVLRCFLWMQKLGESARWARSSAAGSPPASSAGWRGRTRRSSP